MTAKQFYEAVVKMREAQKRFFKTRLKAHLQESLNCEKAVDQEIKRVHKIEYNKQNPTLL